MMRRGAKVRRWGRWVKRAGSGCLVLVVLVGISETSHGSRGGTQFRDGAPHPGPMDERDGANPVGPR